LPYSRTHAQRDPQGLTQTFITFHSKGRREEDGERAASDDAEDRHDGELEVAFVLVAVGFELLGGVNRRVLVDVRLAVPEAELVHITSLAVPQLGRGARLGGAFVANTSLATLGLGALFVESGEGRALLGQC
jgi:hypothetical protein